MNDGTKIKSSVMVGPGVAVARPAINMNNETDEINFMILFFVRRMIVVLLSDPPDPRPAAWISFDRTMKTATNETATEKKENWSQTITHSLRDSQP